MATKRPQCSVVPIAPLGEGVVLTQDITGHFTAWHCRLMVNASIDSAHRRLRLPAVPCGRAFTFNHKLGECLWYVQGGAGFPTCYFVEHLKRDVFPPSCRRAVIVGVSAFYTRICYRSLSWDWTWFGEVIPDIPGLSETRKQASYSLKGMRSRKMQKA